MSDAGAPKTAKYPTKLRRNYPRSRNGCLTCRQRKKKCDEARPLCAGCARNKLSCVWPARAQTGTGSGSGSGSAGSAGSASPAASPAHPGPSPLLASSNLALYQHKSRWQTYLPSLAAWEGVEGCSVNLNPAYDETGRRRDAVASGLATARTPAGTSPAGIDDSDSALPPSSSQTDDGEDEDQDGEDDNAHDAHSLHAEGDGEDEDDDQDAILAAWSPSLGSFVADAAPAPHPRAPRPALAAAASGARRRRQQQQQQQQRRRRPSAACPAPSLPPQHRRVAAMTPLSASMLRHYIVEAAPTLATSRAARNPYIAAFLPLAYTDDLLMHCVLAIGGAHLSNRLTKPDASTAPSPFGSSGPASAALTAYRAPDTAAAALHEATTRHYTCVLRSLRAALRDLQPSDGPQVLRVLAVLLLLSTYECLSWNILGGGVFAHLRASRQLIGWLRGGGGDSTVDGAVLSPDERSLLGALLEIYAYQVLANRVCPDGSIPGRSAAGEDTAGHDDEDFVADPSLLQDNDCFGLLFSGLHGLFALIPPVSRLAADPSVQQPGRQQRRQQGPGRAPSSLSSLFAEAASFGPASLPVAAQVAALRNRALAWQLPAAVLAQAAGDQERIWQRAIGEVYRHGVLIYLETIGAEDDDDDDGHDGNDGNGGNGGNDRAANDKAATLQRHIHAIGEAVLGADLVASRFATILLWPLLIAGSILVHPDERTFLAEGLRASPQTTWSSIRAADVLEQLWARRDSAVLGPAPAGSSSRQYYGPHGLAQIMRETNVNLCVG